MIERCCWEAERISMGHVFGVQFVQHTEAPFGALMIAPGELGFQVQRHGGVRVGLQGVGGTEAEAIGPTRPERVPPHEPFEFFDRPELGPRGQDRERLLGEEARKIVAFVLQQLGVVGGGLGGSFKSNRGLVNPTWGQVHETAYRCYQEGGFVGPVRRTRGSQGTQPGRVELA